MLRSLLSGFLTRRPPAQGCPTQIVGRVGERCAARFIRRSGMSILARNLKLRRGEIDLLARERDGGIVVVEVKSRVSVANARWQPEHALTPAKRQKLRSLAEDLRDKNNWRDRPIRVDLIAVRFDPGPNPLGRNGETDPEIRHHRDALA
ncbi:MAG: YraN family protein [Planctomycetota bacterium]